MLGVLVLAAGASSRFEAGNKLLAPFRGKPVVSHVVSAIDAFNPPLRIVVLAGDNPALRACFRGFDVVHLSDSSAGQSASLAAGVHRASQMGANRVLVVLADMPLVTVQLLRDVVARAADDRPAAASIGGRAQPPACFPAAYFQRLMALKGDVGAREMLAALTPSELVIAGPDDLRDIDSVADLRDLG